MYTPRWCHTCSGCGVYDNPPMASVLLSTLPGCVTRVLAGKLLYITALVALSMVVYTSRLCQMCFGWRVIVYHDRPPVASVWLCTAPGGVTRVLAGKLLYMTAPGSVSMAVYTPRWCQTCFRWHVIVYDSPPVVSRVFPVECV